jgi:hypothetical protein
MRRSLLLAAAAVGGAAAMLGAGRGHVAPGDAPKYKFEAPLDNGLGVTSLEALHGKPVVVEFWATY